jgi:hypothetical protein
LLAGRDQLRVRLREGDAAPGFPNARVLFLGNSAGGEDVIVAGHLEGPGITTFRNSLAVWAIDGDRVQPLIRGGMPVPGSPGATIGANIYESADVAMSAEGVAVFSAPISRGGESAGEAIFAWDSTRGLRKIFASGDRVQINSTAVREVRDWQPISGMGSRSTGIPMVIRFADDSSGIFFVVPPDRTCIADFDGDRGVTVNDLVEYILAFSDGAIAADMPGGEDALPDGGVEVNDLLTFIAHFESGC